MKRGGRSFHVDFQNFVLQIYVVGYRAKGESIVVLLKEGDSCFFSVVLDCFCVRDDQSTINKTISILEENRVNCLSMLIMTHPHEDHILGIETLLDNYCNQSTKFIYPTPSFEIEQGLVSITEQEKNILRQVREKNRITRTFSNPVGVPFGSWVMLETVLLHDYDDVDEETPIPIEFVALTPIASVNDAKIANKAIDLNDLSIAVLINIREYYLFLGADTTNAHILKLDSDIMSAVKFVKIPHHASDTSYKLLNFFTPDQLDYACSTSFHMGQSHLPLSEVLDAYAIVSRRLDVVGCEPNDARPGMYGSICYQFNPGLKEMRSTVQLEGITNQYK